MSDKRREWLSLLQAGSIVAITARWSSEVEHLSKVTRITPSGRIIVAGCEFNPDGFERTSGSYARRMLVSATAEVCLAFNRKRLARSIRKVINDNMHLLEGAKLETLQQIDALLLSAVPMEARR